MSSFSADWLSAREPVDHAARSENVLSAVSHYFLDRKTLNITDIGCGTGSTIRAMKPFVAQTLEWHLIDHDTSLLEQAKRAAGSDLVTFTRADLAKSLDAVFKYPVDLVTTSAFLDLVSETWLQWLVGELSARKLPFYAALTYDGRAECTPPHELDATVLEAFNRHQKTDKGFGPALGPDAAEMAVSLFEKAGYSVLSDQSDWIGDHNHPLFQEILLEGWSAAAGEIEPHLQPALSGWLEFRQEKIATGQNRVMVGHKDILAVPK